MYRTRICLELGELVICLLELGAAILRRTGIDRAGHSAHRLRWNGHPVRFLELAGPILDRTRIGRAILYRTRIYLELGELVIRFLELAGAVLNRAGVRFKFGETVIRLLELA